MQTIYIFVGLVKGLGSIKWSLVKGQVTTYVERKKMLQGDFLEYWQEEEAKWEQLFVNQGKGDDIALVSLTM